MEEQHDPLSLARLCFRRVPDDVSDRDVVLAALWHSLVEYAREQRPIPGRTIRQPILGKRAGLRATDFRAALAELEQDGLIWRANNGYGLTGQGHLAVRQIVDGDQVIAWAKANPRAA